MIWTRQPDSRSRDAQHRRDQLRAHDRGRVPRTRERRGEHQQHRVRQRHRGPVLEPQHEQLAEHETRRRGTPARRSSPTGRRSARREPRRGRRSPRTCMPPAQAHCFALSSSGQEVAETRRARARPRARPRSASPPRGPCRAPRCASRSRGSAPPRTRGGTACPTCRAAPGTRPPAAAPCGTSGSRSSRRTRRRP